MPAQRTFGMDHPHHEWSPIISRPALRWPNGAAVALCVVLVLEHMEWQAPEGSFQVANLSGGSAPALSRLCAPSHREYGHRVGIFRLLDLLDKHGIPATIAMDAMTAENYPYLVQHCIGGGCEIIGHGISVSRTISANMSEDEERGYIRSSIDSLVSATGSAPQGWFGPEYGESDRTPQLLAEAGLRYVCDWANDEQPYPMTTGDTPFFALPLLVRTGRRASHGPAQVRRRRSSVGLTESFDTLLEDGASQWASWR